MSSPAGLRPRNHKRGRPRTSGDLACDRCGRLAGKLRAHWPEGGICGICFTTAMRTRGTCPGCGEDRLLPGTNDRGEPVCTDCAGIEGDYHCARCGIEGEIFRQGICARCALHRDLTEQLSPSPDGDNSALAQALVNALCSAHRPESIHTWKRSLIVQGLLTGIGDGTIVASHESLDAQEPSRAVEHLRAILVDVGLLPQRDPDLARFERWITAKLDPLPDHVAHPVQEFATWHHLRRIRTLSESRSTAAAVRSAKQEITETIKFLTWLDQEHHRTASTCNQPDVDSYLADGPTTRTLIRTFFVFARKTHMNRTIIIGHRPARSVPDLTEEQRLLWIREILSGTSETLPYRVAGMLLLLLAQPLTKVAALRRDDVLETPEGLKIRLGPKPLALPEPFADLFQDYMALLRDSLDGSRSRWIFPGGRAGQHLRPGSIMFRLRELGIDLRAARNSSLANLVTHAPPSLVADALGYSHQTTFRHAEKASEHWSRYAAGAR